VLAVDIAALLEGFRHRFCGLMTIDDQVAMAVIPATDERPPPINHGSNYQQNVNPGMFYSSDRSSDNCMGNMGSLIA
jgi:hypothetical protein